MKVNGESVIAVEWRDKGIRQIVTDERAYFCYPKKDGSILIDFLDNESEDICYQFWVDDFKTFQFRFSDFGIDVSPEAEQIFLEPDQLAALETLITDDALIEGDIVYCQVCDDYQGIEMGFHQSPCRHLQFVDMGFWGGCGGEDSDDIYAESFKALVVGINKDPCGHFDSVDRLIVELARCDFLFIDPDDYRDREGCEPACRYLESLKGTPTPGAVHWDKAVKWVRRGNRNEYIRKRR